jgi:hypothetical protein
LENELFIDPIWIIEGYPDYFFGNDKYLYRIKADGKARQCKLTVIGYTKGYVLKSKFFSLIRLKGMIQKNKNIHFASSYAIIKRKNV